MSLLDIVNGSYSENDACKKLHIGVLKYRKLLRKHDIIPQYQKRPTVNSEIEKNCPICGKIFKSTPSNGFKTYCSHTCANKYRTHKEDTKIKISKSVKIYHQHTLSDILSGSIEDGITLKIQEPKIYYKCCVVCGSEFQSTSPICRITCCNTCSNKLHSSHRILKCMTFNNKRFSTTYKHITIDCDSELEQIGIEFLIDTYDFSDIKRSKIILSFKDADGISRKFNPDFIARKDNKTYLIEVKMLWSATSQHQYNKHIPFKKAKLFEFCNIRGFIPIWLDFNFSKEFKRRYFNRRKICPISSNVEQSSV